jgi:hypothetical protein
MGGAEGIYYRAMTELALAGEADQFCPSLKAAGGEIIQSNGPRAIH